MHHRNERKQAREAKHFTAYEVESAAATGPVCPHGIHMDNACGACVPPRGTSVRAARTAAEDRRLAAMFAGDDDSLAVVPNEGAK